MDRSPNGRVIPWCRAWRMYRVLTQSELAQAAGVHRDTVLNAEKGEEIRVGNIRKIAVALGITADQLVHEPPPKERRKVRGAA